MKIDGACFCGRIAFTAETETSDAVICHCTDCQKMSGAPYRTNVRAVASSFQLQRGTPKTFEKTADSGATRVHAFCGDCGAPVYAFTPPAPEYYTLRLGLIAQKAQFKPARQIWLRSSWPWVADLNGVPGKQTQ